MAGGVDQPGDAGRDEMLVLDRLQHVERFLVGEGRVVDVLDAVADALLDRTGRAGMGGDHLVAAARLGDGHRHLFLRHRRLLGAHAGDLLAGEVELDGIDAVFDQRSHRAADFLGAGDDEAEIEPLVRDVRGRGVAEAADRGDLGTGREIARPREAALVDEASWRTTSSRGLAAAAPRPPVKPASSTSLAISMVTSMCSSSSIIWIGSMPGALFQERCRCASIMPGISVAPMPSITVAPPIVDD